MDFMTFLVQLVTAFLGALGFAILFQVNRNHLLPAAAGGFLVWLVYLLCGSFTGSDVLKCFLASIVVTFYSEFMARWKKTPAVIFLAPGTIPLMPGGFLYQTMEFAFNGEWENAFFEGLYTILLAAAISGGILMTLTFWGITERLVRKVKDPVRGGGASNPPRPGGRGI